MEINRANKLRYKDELDKQRQQRDAMLAYGNMSAAEKRINKRDLMAYKTYDTTNHAMVPGHKPKSEMPNRTSETKPASPKKTIEEKVKDNTHMLQKYGAAHLGAGVATLEPHMYLGGGGLLKNDSKQKDSFANQPEDRTSSPMPYQQAPGTHLGSQVAGGLLNDGSVPVEDQKFLEQRNNRLNASYEPGPGAGVSDVVPRPFGDPKPLMKKSNPRLKSEVNLANGGIGVTFSNVNLGQASPDLSFPKSSYKHQFEAAQPRRAASPQVGSSPATGAAGGLTNNYTHKSRFINNQQAALNVQSTNSLAYVKGVDFNSQNKYDYDILNN